MSTGHGGFVRQHFHDKSLGGANSGFARAPEFDPDKERAARSMLANREIAFIKSLHQKAENDEWMKKMEPRWQAHIRTVGIDAAMKETSPHFKFNRAREAKKMEVAKAAEAARIEKLEELDKEDNARMAKRQRVG